MRREFAERLVACDQDCQLFIVQRRYLAEDRFDRLRIPPAIRLCPRSGRQPDSIQLVRLRYGKVHDEADQDTARDDSRGHCVVSCFCGWSAAPRAGKLRTSTY